MSEVIISTQDKADSLWQSCFDGFEEVIDKSTFEMVLKYTKPIYRERDFIELSVSKGWQKDRLEKSIDLISGLLSNKSGRKINITVSLNKNGDSENNLLEQNLQLIDKSNGKQKDPPVPKKTYTPKGDKEFILDPRYIFDTFVVGNGNRIAEAAAQAVAEAPAKAYNPLFIYGGVGLGKTHLLHAIGNKVLKKNPDARIVYVSAEKFMNDFVESIQEKKMKQFRRKYRFSDVFLIDDIQFIKNKELMQEEFFHTFNELHGAKSQIVITSDRSPKDIPTLEDRLRSRFEWGLIADIQAPELETRIAILRKKAKLENIDVSSEVISYIAEKIPSNIRELEGALNRVVCEASLSRQKIDLDLCITALKEIIPNSKPKHLTIPFIQEKVCEYYGIEIEDMLGSCREARLVLPRHIAMYLSKELLGTSFPAVAKEFGGKDHVTVMNACKRIAKKLKDPSIKNDIENVKSMLKNLSG